MKLWRLSPTRSIARKAEAVLRDSWQSGRWSYRRARLGFRMRSLPQLVVPLVLSAILFLPPLIGGFGRSMPPWLSDAWQVSGVLIGFALALFVFLMEALVDRSLRSSATFRTVIRNAGIEWPLALGLAFIAYAAVGARWSGDSQPLPSWAETWVLCLFLIQLGSFALVFGRGISLIPPGAVIKMIRRSFRNASHEATRRQLRRRLSSNFLKEACEEASAEQEMPDAVSFTPFGISGKSVHSPSRGEIKDIDLKLAKRLASLRPAGPIGLTMAITEPVGPERELARLDDSLGGSFAREVLSGVDTGRRSRDLETHEIFREAIDFARRALSTDSAGDLDLALEIIEGAFSEVAASWQAFGVSYEASRVQEFFSLSLADQMSQDLRDLAIDFVNDGDPRFVRALFSLSYRLMLAGYRQDAPLLSQHGESLNLGLASLLR